MQEIDFKSMPLKWKNIKLFNPSNKTDVNGVPIDQLPAEELEITANKILNAPRSTKMMTRTRRLFSNIQKDMTKEGKLSNSRQKRVVENIKGEPVLLKDHISTRKYTDLKPLKKVMQLALKSIGEVPGNTIDIVSEQFYNKIIRPSKKTGIANFEYDYPVLYPSQMTYDFADNAKDVITEAILKFVRVARRKKDSGQDLTKVEQILADGSEIVEKNLQETAKTEAARNLGERLLFDRKTQFIVIGVIVGIVLIVLAIRRR